MIALRSALTLVAVGDVEGYSLVLEGLDDTGRPFSLRLGGFVADRLVAEYQLVVEEHREAVAPPPGWEGRAGDD